MTASTDAPRTASTWLAAVLLAGTALLGTGAVLHPMLPATLAGQLGVIARTTDWRTIHLVMLVGSALVMIGLWGQLGIGGTRRSPLVAIFATIVVGLALNASNIAFMAQMGTADAARYMQGHEAAAAGFAQGHSASLLRARIGNGLVAIACLALAATTWAHARVPRVLSVLAAIAAVGGMVGVSAFDPASREAVAAVALFSVWAAVAAIRVLAGRGRWRARESRRTESRK
jgi:hypothetical protein